MILLKFVLQSMVLLVHIKLYLKEGNCYKLHSNFCLSDWQTWSFVIMKQMTTVPSRDIQVFNLQKQEMIDRLERCVLCAVRCSIRSIRASVKPQHRRIFGI